MDRTAPLGTEQLEFTNGRWMASFVSAVTGVIGVGFLVIGVAAFRQGGALFALLAPVLLGVSLAFGLGRNIVAIEPGSRRIVHTWTFLNREWTEEYPLHDFQEVGVRSAGAGTNSGRVHYRVMLKGARSVYLPGCSFRHAADAMVLARDVAARTGLAVDETPRIGFFGR